MPNPTKFPYRRISYSYLPHFYKLKNLALIKVGLCKNGRTTKPESFIDTGAQYCMFNNGYAKYLGIENFKDVPKDHIIPLIGIGGTSSQNTAYFHKVDLRIYLDQRHLIPENSILARNIEVAFLEKDFDIGGILGVYGFLDRFSFLANIKDGFFEITPLFECDS